MSIVGQNSGSSPPPLPLDSVYTANWCEENVYLLARSFLTDQKLCEVWRIYAVFISNHSKSVALWNQKLREDIVLWDYHVVLALTLRPRLGGLEAARSGIQYETEKGTDASQALDPRDGSGERPRNVWVYDMDSRLDMPCRWEGKMSLAFCFNAAAEAGWTVSDAYRSMFRIVAGEEYLEGFASDRTHMISTEPGPPWYLSPPPHYECIQGARAKSGGISNNLMSSFVDMTGMQGYGQVCSLEEAIAWVFAILQRCSSSHTDFVSHPVVIFAMSASPSAYTTNGRAHSFGASSYPPSLNDVAAPTNGVNGTGQSSPALSRDGGYGVAGPSSSVNGFVNTDYTSHNERIVSHLYNAGFQMGEYADTLLHARQNRYQLHAIILSRSPYLAHLMSTSPKQGGMNTIHVPLESLPEITDQGFAVALGYLYSSISLHNLAPSNARAVLAAGCLLGGMSDLCGYAYQACRDSITVDTIDEWIEFVNNIPSEDGIATPSEVQRPTVLGAYAPQLRSDVFDFLVVTLPNMLDVLSAASSGRDTLLAIFSRLPFDLFKNAMESPMFQIGSDQERFRFAKAAIDLRKRTRGGGAEEAVVLAFGGGHSGSAVHVTRKTRRRALFKVG
ncbi:hypothetical protein M0805_003019 [Coniferiporia weirii]|nr:hypothetical protein M0805_003019 [Coniferiporia weirii]